MTGIERIAAERQRQVDVEGWTPEHDDEHTNGELAQAAIAYATVGAQRSQADVARAYFPREWHPDSWKPSDDPIRNLEKAGALIAAEIDRLERAGGGVPETTERAEQRVTEWSENAAFHRFLGGVPEEGATELDDDGEPLRSLGPTPPAGHGVLWGDDR